MRPAGVTRRCCAPGQMYSVPGCTVSLASASFTRMLVNSASCAAYCVVKAAGMCCTRKTAAGKSRVNPGARRITVAGPPVEAPSTTTGKRWSAGIAGDVRAGAESFGAALPFVPCTERASLDAVRTTRTFAATRTLRSSSSLTLCMSRSMPLEGLATNSMAPSSSALSVLAAPSFDSELTITMGRGFVVMICAVACRPSMCGMLMSMVMTSGFSDSASATASRPSLAWPATCNWSSPLKIASRTLRMNAESSTINTRNFLLAAGAIARLRHRYGWARRLRSHELFDRSKQLIFLHRLGQKRCSAFFNGAVAVLGAGARRDDHDGDAARRRALPQLHHQLVAGHARHFEVRDDKMAAVLRDEFRGFQAIGGQLHAIAVLFKHAAHKFAYADGIIGDDNDALVLDAIDGLGGNRAASDCRGAGSEDARGRCGSLQGAALARFRGYHAIQVDQQNQAAVRSNSCAREELDAAKVFAEIFDNDFIFADDFLDHEPDLAIAGVRHDHAEVAVDRFERRQTEVRVQANNFGDDIANLCQQLAADVFDLVGAEAPDFLDDR